MIEKKILSVFIRNRYNDIVDHMYVAVSSKATTNQIERTVRSEAQYRSYDINACTLEISE